MKKPVKKSEKIKTFSVSLKPANIAKAKRSAKDLGVSTSYLVNDLIEKYKPKKGGKTMKK